MTQQQTTALENAITGGYGNIAGLVIRNRGETVYEAYFNERKAADKIHVFSVTKSVVSILVGIAMDRGAINSTDQKVLDFFPDYAVKRGEKTIQQVTLKNLLSMTAPYKYKSAPYTKYFTSEDWVKTALDLLGGKGPIGEFRYTPLIGPDILSGILVKATGHSVLDFARENLFAPLGIDAPTPVTFNTKEEQAAFLTAKNINSWVADPKGTNTAGWGLTLTAADMAKIGQLYLDNGAWNGKQIVSAAWVAESTAEHSRWKELDLPYGYLWWAGIGNGGFAATGDSGNVIYVNPKKKTVVAIASLYMPTAKDRIALIEQYIEPMFEVCG